MVIERTKNATRNMMFGFMQHTYQIVLPFIMRTLMVYIMGMRYLGLNSLFASVLQVLNIAELGVGSAMVFSMYKPIAEDDGKTVCALMRLYKIYYRVIGAVVAAAGLALLPFIHLLIKMDTVPEDINIYVLYLMNLGSTVMSYWLFAYKNCLLSAHQREDVASRIVLVMNTFLYAMQAVVIIFFHNYYLYYLAVFIIQILTNIVTAVAVNRMYPEYRARGHLCHWERSVINQRVRDLFLSKIASTIVYSTDTIVISAFLGLELLAVYQNYYFISSSITAVLSVVYNSCRAGIGNSIVVEKPRKNFEDLKKFTFIIIFISCICSCCLLGLYQPFMRLWVGEENLMAMPAVVLLTASFFVWQLNMLLNLYKDAAGIWGRDKLRTILTAAANLTMNLALVEHWGIYGVILSTLLSTLFIGMPWLIKNLFTEVFEKHFAVEYLAVMAKYGGVSIAVCAVSTAVCGMIRVNDIAALFIYGAFCCLFPALVFIVLFSKNAEFKGSVALADNMTGGRFKLYRRFYERSDPK